MSLWRKGFREPRMTPTARTLAFFAGAATWPTWWTAGFLERTTAGTCSAASTWRPLPSTRLASRVAVQAGDLAGIVLEAPPRRRGGRQWQPLPLLDPEALPPAPDAADVG